MKVIIKKTLDIVVDIPEDRVKDYLGDNISESSFIQWADQVYLECPIFDEAAPEDKRVSAWINGETTKGITVEHGPKEIQDKYSETEINNILDEIDRAERCYECGGYGDDYSYDDEAGELVSNCETCPFNSLNQDS